LVAAVIILPLASRERLAMRVTVSLTLRQEAVIVSCVIVNTLSHGFLEAGYTSSSH